MDRTLGTGMESAAPTPAEANLTADQESFSAFYAGAREPLYRTLLVTTRSPQLAEDAVHEAFARAFADWERVSARHRPTVRPGAWLTTPGD